MDANSNEDFNTQVTKAVDAKTQWYDSTVLPGLQEEYRLHLSVIRNLFDMLAKRSIIVPDPYKRDNKISSIVCPEETPFNENERATQMGLRLSNYESMVDFICNYMKFTVENLSVEKIKKMLDLNNTFSWDNLSTNSSRVNTNGLAAALSELRSGGMNMTLSMLIDSLEKTGKDMAAINKTLRSLADFEREYYKGEVRKRILANNAFDFTKRDSAGAFVMEIKRLFPQCMPKRPFMNDLVSEIVSEETSANRISLQLQLLERLQIEEEVKEEQTEKVDTHEILMNVIKTIGSMSDQYSAIINKVMINHAVLVAGQNSLKERLVRFFRKLFGIPEPKVVYELVLPDRSGSGQRHDIVYTSFIENLMKRAKYYATISSPAGANYHRFDTQPENVVSGFANTQIRENGRLHVELVALDEYFKNNANPSDRSKIKGIKMELMTLKNLVMRANQLKVEYDAYVEEHEQMKKLEIKS